MVKLGDEVQDTVTGFKGIAVARYEYLSGCARFGVQPKAVKNVLPKQATFDEPLLKVIKAKATIRKKTNNGGPALYTDERSL